MPLYANSLYILTNSVVTAAVGFVFWFVAARFYSDADVGLGSAAISAMSLLSAVSLLGLNFGLVRFLASSGKRAPELINTCFTIGSAVSAVAAVIFLLGVGIWSPALRFISQNGIYFASFVIFTVASTALSLSNYTFIAERRTGYSAGQGAIFSIIKVGLVVILAIFFGSFGIFSSWGLATVVAVGISIFIFLPRIQAGYRPATVIKGKMVKEIFRFSFQNYLSGLLWDAPMFILPIIVLNVLGAEQNAYFYIAWAFGGILRSIPMATSLSLLAEGSSNQERLTSHIQRSLKITLILLLPAVVLTLTIGDKLLVLFGPAYSQQGTKLLWLVAIAALPISVNFIYLSVRRVEKRLKGVLLLTAFVAIVTLGLSYVLLPRMSLAGTGIAWLTAQGVPAVIILAGWIRRRRVSPDNISTSPNPGRTAEHGRREDEQTDKYLSIQ